MVVIRLSRGGSKKRPFYRMVVADSRMPRDGRYIEQIGTYNPRIEKGRIAVKLDRFNHWKGLGAQPSDTVRTIMKKYEALNASA